VLSWLRRALGGSSLGGSSREARAVMNVLDEVWHPGAAKAREDHETRHERAVPAPSPGDRILRSGRVVIGRRQPAGGAHREGDRQVREGNGQVRESDR
jgi:hypothetical protein